MVRCKECGYLFMNQDECPCCHSKYVGELEECIFCGKPTSAPYIWNGVCTDCQKEHATAETALAYGERYTDVIEINGFVSYFLGQDRINEILTNAVRNSSEETLKKDAFRFLDDDFDCYTLFLNDMKDDPDGVHYRSKLHRNKVKRSKER